MGNIPLLSSRRCYLRISGRILEVVMAIPVNYTRKSGVQDKLRLSKKLQELCRYGPLQETSWLWNVHLGDISDKYAWCVNVNHRKVECFWRCAYYLTFCIKYIAGTLLAFLLGSSDDPFHLSFSKIIKKLYWTEIFAFLSTSIIHK